MSFLFYSLLSSTNLHESSQIAIRIRDEWMVLPFQMGKGKEAMDRADAKGVGLK